MVHYEPSSESPYNHPTVQLHDSLSISAPTYLGARASDSVSLYGKDPRHPSSPPPSHEYSCPHDWSTAKIFHDTTRRVTRDTFVSDAFAPRTFSRAETATYHENHQRYPILVPGDHSPHMTYRFAAPPYPGRTLASRQQHERIGGDDIPPLRSHRSSHALPPLPYYSDEWRQRYDRSYEREYSTYVPICSSSSEVGSSRMTHHNIPGDTSNHGVRSESARLPPPSVPTTNSNWSLLPGIDSLAGARTVTNLHMKAYVNTGTCIGSRIPNRGEPLRTEQLRPLAERVTTPLKMELQSGPLEGRYSLRTGSCQGEIPDKFSETQSSLYPTTSHQVNQADRSCLRGTKTCRDLQTRKTEPKKHLCEECGKVFPRPSGVSIHARIHTGEKPHTCTFGGCNKSFNVMSNLKRHLKTHGIHPTGGRTSSRSSRGADSKGDHRKNSKGSRSASKSPEEKYFGTIQRDSGPTELRAADGHAPHDSASGPDPDHPEPPVYRIRWVPSN